MAIVWTLVIGFFVGLVARVFKPGDDSMGWVMTTLLGIAGAFLAGFVGQTFGWYMPGEPAGFLSSVVGAVILLVIGNTLTHGGRHSPHH